MLVVTTDDLPGFEVRKVLGEVIGATSRLRNPFFDKIRTLPRGDLHPRRTHHLVRWRKEVIAEMVQAAQERGANAVVGMRFDHREISDVWGEMCAYGTAVYVVPAAGQQADPTTPAPASQQAPPPVVADHSPSEPAGAHAPTARGRAAIP